jgi:zinc protease
MTVGRAATQPVPIPEIEHYELDDVPLFHIPTPGSTILALSFGVGRAHEPFTQGGMTHFAEHLVMHAVSDTFDHSNGVTEPFRVSFLRRGSPQEVSKFLADVCRAIERPRLQRMSQELIVLKTEAVGRGGGVSLPALLDAYRFGYRGLGAWSLSELFLRDPDEAALTAWMREHLVAGNAVIWIAGELPDGLLVELAPGPATPLPDTTAVRGLETPTRVTSWFVLGAAASFFAARSTAMTMAIRVLHQRLMRALRVDRALAYEIGVNHTPLAADHAISAVWATCLPRYVKEVEKILLEAVDEVASRGCTEDDLERQYTDLARSLTEPNAAAGLLDAHARDWLLGRRSTTSADVVADHARLSPGDVAEAFRAARETMILLTPPTDPDPHRSFRPYIRAPQEQMGKGRTFKQARVRPNVPWAAVRSPRLTVGDVGVAIDSERGQRLMAVRWNDCVGVVQDPGARSVFATSGTQLRVYADEWRDGNAAMALIDRLAPRAVSVPPDPTGQTALA